MIACMYYRIKAKMRYLDNHSFLFFCLFFSLHIFLLSNKGIFMSYLILRSSVEAGLVTRQNTDKSVGGKGLHKHRCNWRFGQPEAC